MENEKISSEIGSSVLQHTFSCEFSWALSFSVPFAVVIARFISSLAVSLMSNQTDTWELLFEHISSIVRRSFQFPLNIRRPFIEVSRCCCFRFSSDDSIFYTKSIIQEGRQPIVQLCSRLIGVMCLSMLEMLIFFHSSFFYSAPKIFSQFFNIFFSSFQFLPTTNEILRRKVQHQQRAEQNSIKRRFLDIDEFVEKWFSDFSHLFNTENYLSIRTETDFDFLLCLDFDESRR